MSTIGQVFPLAGAGGFTDAQSRQQGAAWGDGIVNDNRGTPGSGGDGGSAFGLGASASSRGVTLFNLGQYRVRGTMFMASQDSYALTLPAPAAGQQQAHLIVAEIDLAANPVDIAFKVVSGPASSAVPSRPGLTRNPAGKWQDPIWMLRGDNAASSTLERIDFRHWVGATYAVWSVDALNPMGSSVPIGSRTIVMGTGDEYLLRSSNGVLEWINLDDPDWTNLGLPTGATTGMTSHDATPQYRVARGKVELQGSLKRTSGSNLTEAGGGSGVTLFTLPAGARPSRLQRFPTAPYGYVLINQSGQVTFADRAANAFVNLDGITFPAAAS